jgi:glucose/arabinose dehydrogenase
MFGPDGYLYMAPGDGAFSQNAQNTNTLLGKVLRIDVTDEITYSVPASNPFTQTVNYRPEIWAYGLRNPWRFSFDMETGEFYIADVGQEQWEEVNRQPAGSSGQNYGWRCYEGNHTFNTSGCPISTTLTFPITEYSHALGSAIAGGYVYRGAEYPSLDGYYFFADNGSRRFWAINTANNEVTALGQMLSPGANPSTFGQDPEGEMYVADLSSGNIYKLKGPLPPPPVQTPSFLPLLRLDE